MFIDTKVTFSIWTAIDSLHTSPAFKTNAGQSDCSNYRVMAKNKIGIGWLKNYIHQIDNYLQLLIQFNNRAGLLVESLNTKLSESGFSISHARSAQLLIIGLHYRSDVSKFSQFIPSICSCCLHATVAGGYISFSMLQISSQAKGALNYRGADTAAAEKVRHVSDPALCHFWGSLRVLPRLLNVRSLNVGPAVQLVLNMLLCIFCLGCSLNPVARLLWIVTSGHIQTFGWFVEQYCAIKTCLQ